DWYTNGEPIGNIEDSYGAIGAGWWPVITFLAVAFIFHIALRYTRYGKFTYAIGANPLAARVSGINVERHILLVYTLAGLLSRPRGGASAAPCSSASRPRASRSVSAAPFITKSSRAGASPPRSSPTSANSGSPARS